MLLEIIGIVAGAVVGFMLNRILFRKKSYDLDAVQSKDRSAPEPRLNYPADIFCYDLDAIQTGQFAEKRTKIMYNPFERRWFWTVLNPKLHVWEWQKPATGPEIEKWMQLSDDTKANGFLVGEEW